MKGFVSLLPLAALVATLASAALPPADWQGDAPPQPRAHVEEIARALPPESWIPDKRDAHLAGRQVTSQPNYGSLNNPAPVPTTTIVLTTSTQLVTLTGVSSLSTFTTTTSIPVTSSQTAAQTTSTNKAGATSGNSRFWNGQGPNYYNVKQVKVKDCWLSAATIAMALTAPQTMANLFMTPDGTSLLGQTDPVLDQVMIALYDPVTLQKQNYLANLVPTDVYTDGYKTEDRYPDGVWWPSAIHQGFHKLGATGHIFGFTTDMQLNQTGGTATEALSALSGKSSTFLDIPYYRKSGGIDKFFEELSQGIYTPMVVSTPAEVGHTYPTTIYANHAYAVWNTTTYENGTRSVWLRNPWGATEEFESTVLMDNLWGVSHLFNWERFT